MISRNVPALLWTIPESFLLVQASPVVGLIILQPCLWEVIVTKILIIFAKGHPQLELSRLQGSDMPRRQHERAPDKCCVAPPSESDYYQIHKSASWWADWLLINRMETNQHESNKKAVSPVRSIQHVSHQHTGDIGASLQEEYFLYNWYKAKGAKELHKVVSGLRWDWGGAGRRIFPGFRRLEPTSRSCCWTRSSSWHWQAPGFGFELNQSLVCLKRQHLWTLQGSQFFVISVEPYL